MAMFGSMFLLLSPTLAELQLANMHTKCDLYINEINNNISFHY